MCRGNWLLRKFRPIPRKLLKIRARGGGAHQTKVCADLIFDYAGTMVPGADKRRGLYDAPQRRFLKRNAELEAGRPRPR